jgi:hypothetical protein
MLCVWTISARIYIVNTAQHVYLLYQLRLLLKIVAIALWAARAPLLNVKEGGGLYRVYVCVRVCACEIVLGSRDDHTNG